MNIETRNKNKNIELSDYDYKFIVTLSKFDLIMILSEIDEHGWDGAKQTIEIMKGALS